MSSDIRIPNSETEIKSVIKQRMMEEWQKQWDGEETGQWLCGIQRRAGKMRCTRGRRREESIVSRVRLGQD